MYVKIHCSLLKLIILKYHIIGHGIVSYDTILQEMGQGSVVSSLN